MHFTKMQGAGNDFIIIDNMDRKISGETYSQLAVKLCQRRMGVGADGLMIVEPAEKDGALKMLFYNADGSLGEMCGNGARCIAKYAFEKGLAGEEITIETTAGLVTAWRESDMTYRIRLNDITTLQNEVILTVQNQKYSCSYVELGRPGLPHLVVQIPGMQQVPKGDLWQLGKDLRQHPALPKGANVNFYDTIGEDEIFVRTFERGVEDFTFACGTGTGAVATVIANLGLTSGNHIKAVMEGGILYVDVVCERDLKKKLYLTGSAMVVYEGELKLR